jgi:hypothetical protein
MDYIIGYLIIGYFVSLGFHIMIYFSPVEEKFDAKDALGTMALWPLVSYGFIKELIKHYNEYNGRR